MADDDITSISYQVGRMLAAPDPTERTIQQLQREIQQSREITNARFDGQFKSIESHIAGLDEALTGTALQLRNLYDEKFESIGTQFVDRDRAVVLLQTNSDRHVDIAINQLQNLLEEKIHSIIRQIDEKFHSIATQFIERDTRTEQTSRDSKVAVDAALQAAKEAVGEQNKSNALAIAKSEATFTKQIDQIGVLVSTMQKGIDDKIDDIKTRLQSIESMRLGFQESKSDTRGNSTLLITAIGVGVAIIVAAFSFMHSSTPAPVPQMIQTQPVVPHQ